MLHTDQAHTTSVSCCQSRASKFLPRFALPMQSNGFSTHLYQQSRLNPKLPIHPPTCCSQACVPDLPTTRAHLPPPKCSRCLPNALSCPPTPACFRGSSHPRTCQSLASLCALPLVPLTPLLQDPPVHLSELPCAWPQSSASCRHKSGLHAACPPLCHSSRGRRVRL